MVICRCKRDGLADALLRKRGFAHALKFCRIVERAGTDDATGTLHKAWHRVNGSDATRVGERNSRAGEVVSTEFVVASAFHQVFVSNQVLGEIELLSALDVWNKQRTSAVWFRNVDCQTEVDVRRGNSSRLAIDYVVVDVLRRKLFKCTDNRVADDVGERNLAATGARQVRVDHNAVVDHQLCRNRANASCGRHLERGIHVGGKRLAHAL